MATVDQILGAAENFARTRGYRFGDESRREMAQMIARAVESGADEQKTVNALETFIERMIKAAQEIPGYAEESPGVIGERTFGIAHNSLCPLPPIC